MGTPIIIEYTLGRLLSASKGRDDWLLVNQPVVKGAPNAVEVTCELGPSNSQFRLEHTGLGNEEQHDVLPAISSIPDAAIASAVKEYLLIIEDPDSPLPPRIMEAVHGLFYAIPASKTSVRHDDLTLVESPSSKIPVGAKQARGGFRVGLNGRCTTYGGPRPLCGHGEHRYFFGVVALKTAVDAKAMSAVATKSQLLKEIEGQVLGSGVWVGVYEHKWE